MKENELVARAANGDVDAFCTLYDRYKQKLVNFAYFRLGNLEDAEDLVQECMLKVFENLPALQKPEAFTAWIYKILYRDCATFLKRRAREQDNEDIENYTDILPADTAADFESIELRQALGQLAEDERNIVLLSVVSGLKSKEIAQITGLTAGNVRQKLRRSLAKMRRILA
ncbi:MAG: RNA polymerase sigma factor [Clostridiales bacterium]|nr:RNA polymerase sigma factor [Clostridiales bacterium]